MTIRLPGVDFPWVGGIVTIRLSSTVMEVWRLKDNGVTNLTFWGHVTSSVTWPFDSQGSTLYGWSIVTMRLSSSQADYNCYRVIANFVPNFVAMATGVGWRKCDWQHSVAHPQKPPPYRRKSLADIFYTGWVIANFVPNFVAVATGVSRGKCNWQRSMAHPLSLIHISEPTRPY